MLINCKLIVKYYQCGRELRSDDHDEGHPAPQREGALEPARHLQVLLRHRRRVLPLRRAGMLDEVWQLDVRRVHGKGKSMRNYLNTSRPFLVLFDKSDNSAFHAVGPAPHEPTCDQQQHRSGDGPAGLLHLHRVGRDGGAGPAQ